MLRMGCKHSLLSLLVVGGEEDVYAHEGLLPQENTTRVLRLYAQRGYHECSHHTLPWLLPRGGDPGRKEELLVVFTQTLMLLLACLVDL